MRTDEIVLVVEDNEDDVFFMRRALKETGLQPDQARFVGDGAAALDYLHGRGPFADRSANPMPAIVFLDLKLPLIHGLDVLSAIRSDPKLKGLRIVILTSSSEERDRTCAKRLGVQGYLVKPPTREMLQGVLGMASVTGISRA